VRSTARIRANRTNARRSTGPKSRQGKDRSARNSFKHGLSVQAGKLPEYSPRVEAYVAELVGEEASDELKVAAVSFAEAQVDIDRVRVARLELYEDERSRLVKRSKGDARRVTREKLNYLNSLITYDKKTGEPHILPVTKAEFDERIASFDREKNPLSLEERLGVLAPQLAKLWRYESRALARRDRAEKVFLELIHKLRG
jgi:hypothetical protein